MKLPELSSSLYQYLKKYQEDPNSKVFAPLAEAYRKAGFAQEAIDIAQAGLKVHPHFMAGKVALARALFDQKQYEEVIKELLSVVGNFPDNWAAQRLLGDAYLISGQNSKALEAYKLVLFFHPQDAEVAQWVQELETESYETQPLLLGASRFEVRPLGPLTGVTPDPQKQKRIQTIERLQRWLQKIERYRVLQEVARSKSASMDAI